MPLYDFHCTDGHRFERHVKLADFEEPVFCTCTAPARRVISSPMIAPGFEGYTCPITDKWIGSKYEHSENLKQHGCRVYEPGETEATRRQSAAAEAAMDAAIDQTVEKTIEGFSSEKKERLANELLGGADLAVERK